MTAKEDGLWDTMGGVTREGIRHMKGRVQQIEAEAVLQPGDFICVPRCAPSLCRWLLSDAALFAASVPPAPAHMPRLKLPALPAEE